MTERRKLVGRKIPVIPGGEPEEGRLRALEAKGIARMGRRRLPRGFWEARRPADPAGETRRALLTERE